MTETDPDIFQEETVSMEKELESFLTYLLLNVYI